MSKRKFYKCKKVSCLKQIRRIAEIIEIEEIHDIIEQGTTMPVRCRLKNGEHVVVKYMKNPYGQRVLVNEWIGNNIADIIGLTIPEYGICNMSEMVIENTNYNEDIDVRNAGSAFFSKTYSKTIPIIRAMLSNVKNHETEKIILFDHLVNNYDRHDGNLLCDISNGATLYSIDNSHIITEEPRKRFILEEALSESYILSNAILLSNMEIYDLLCSSVGYSEEKLRACAEDIKNILTEDILLEIKESIPITWSESVGYDTIDNLFCILKKRLSLICEIAEMIIEERRKL